MMTSEMTVPAVMGQVERVASRSIAADTARCLVLSANRARRNMLQEATSQAGWEVAVFADSAMAAASIQRDAYHFAVVDLDHLGQTPNGFRDFVARLATNHRQILLGICGHEADPMEEIWVRQLGIWLYLPGTTNSCEITLLCEQALLVVENQRQTHSMVGTH
jgi:ActR/RegA family two-component response regulator